ncbi:hypothetical protein BY996DRAFT_6409222 [Phakopsora pachyrhizi]|nr:hypothetical protein BY996DRAFT_6409222 [Phakopsora pachyrhizi]
MAKIREAEERISENVQTYDELFGTHAENSASEEEVPFEDYDKGLSSNEELNTELELLSDIHSPSYVNSSSDEFSDMSEIYSGSSENGENEDNSSQDFSFTNSHSNNSPMWYPF